MSLDEVHGGVSADLAPVNSVDHRLVAFLDDPQTSPDPGRRGIVGFGGFFAGFYLCRLR